MPKTPNMTSKNTAKKLPKRYLLSDLRRTPDLAGLIRYLPAETGVVLRHYSAPGRLSLALELRQLCTQYGLKLFVGGDALLARRIGADGVHWPAFKKDAPLKSHLGTRMIHLASAHTLGELGRALRRGADAIFLGPAFHTESHPAARTLGPHRMARMARMCPVPVIALGGLNAQTMRRLPRTLRQAGFGAIGFFTDQS
jgi:thiamine-phosphate pyrophosphorylase